MKIAHIVTERIYEDEEEALFAVTLKAVLTRPEYDELLNKSKDGEFEVQYE